MKVLVGLIIFVGACYLYRRNAQWCFIYFAIVNVLTFLAFGMDKFKARFGWWRTPENVLHFLTAIGGTVGMLFGETVFHHKCSKLSFKRVSYIIVTAQILIVAGFFCYFYLHK